MKYRINELADTFAKHAIRADKHNKEIIKSFKERNPGEPLPDHMKDEFSLLLALESMCREIMELQRAIAVKDFH